MRFADFFLLALRCLLFAQKTRGIGYEPAAEAGGDAEIIVAMEEDGDKHEQGDHRGSDKVGPADGEDQSKGSKGTGQNIKRVDGPAIGTTLGAVYGMDPVMQVIFVRSEGGAPCEDPAKHRAERVEDGKPEGTHEDEDQIVVTGVDIDGQGKYRQKVAEKQTAAITHKDRRRMVVKHEESHQGPEKNHPRKQIRKAAIEKLGTDQKERADSGYTGRQAIEPVDQVKRIDDTDDPDDREYFRYETKAQTLQVPGLELYLVIDRDTGHGNLPKELGPGRHPLAVVIQAHQTEDASADQHDWMADIDEDAVFKLKAAQGPAKKYPCVKGPDNGQTPYPGNRLIVRAPLIGLVDPPFLDRRALDTPRQADPHAVGEEEADDGDDDVKIGEQNEVLSLERGA